MKHEIIKAVCLTFAIGVCACGNDSDLKEVDIVKSDLSKFDDTELVEVKKSFNAEGGKIYIDVTDKDWGIEYVSCDGMESEIQNNLNFKQLCVAYDVVHMYGNLEFRSTEDELSIRVWPNQGMPDEGEYFDGPDGMDTPWEKSSPRKIELILSVGDKKYLYNIIQSGVEIPSLYPFSPEKNLYSLSAKGDERIVNVSTALYAMSVHDESRNTLGVSDNYFPKAPVTIENEWIKIVRDGANIKVEAKPNTTGKERRCNIDLSYQDFFNTVEVVQKAD